MILELQAAALHLLLQPCSANATRGSKPQSKSPLQGHTSGSSSRTSPRVVFFCLQSSARPPDPPPPSLWNSRKGKKNAIPPFHFGPILPPRSLVILPLTTTKPLAKIFHPAPPTTHTGDP